MRIVPIVLTLVLVGAVGATAQTRDGERIYSQTCARFATTATCRRS